MANKGDRCCLSHHTWFEGFNIFNFKLLPNMPVTEIMIGWFSLEGKMLEYIGSINHSLFSKEIILQALDINYIIRMKKQKKKNTVLLYFLEYALLFHSKPVINR